MNYIYDYLQNTIGIDFNDLPLPPVKGLVRKWDLETLSQYYEKQSKQKESFLTKNIVGVSRILSNPKLSIFLKHCLKTKCKEVVNCWNFKKRTWKWDYKPKKRCMFFDEPIIFYRTRKELIMDKLFHTDTWSIRKFILDHLYDLGIGSFNWKELFEDEYDWRREVEILRLRLVR